MSESLIPASYWVIPGKLMAGEYPGAVSNTLAMQKIDWLLNLGVDYLLDLTEPGESGLLPYSQWLFGSAVKLGIHVVHHRMSIRDMGTPSPVWMVRILDVLDRALDDTRNIYMHCYGGIGRTGTVVGCHLVRHGMQGDQAIAQIARWRESIPDGWKRSPETDQQIQMVMNWNVGR